MTFWLVVAVVLAVLLVGTAVHDVRVRARGRRVSGDIGRDVRQGPQHGDVEAYRGSPGLNNGSRILPPG